MNKSKHDMTDERPNPLQARATFRCAAVAMQKSCADDDVPRVVHRCHHTESHAQKSRRQSCTDIITPGVVCRCYHTGSPGNASSPAD